MHFIQSRMEHKAHTQSPHVMQTGQIGLLPHNCADYAYIQWLAINNCHRNMSYNHSVSNHFSVRVYILWISFYKAVSVFVFGFDIYFMNMHTHTHTGLNCHIFSICVCLWNRGLWGGGGWGSEDVLQGKQLNKNTFYWFDHLIKFTLLKRFNFNCIGILIQLMKCHSILNIVDEENYLSEDSNGHTK